MEEIKGDTLKEMDFAKSKVGKREVVTNKKYPRIETKFFKVVEKADTWVGFDIGSVKEIPEGYKSYFVITPKLCFYELYDVFEKIDVFKIYNFGEKMVAEVNLNE